VSTEALVVPENTELTIGNNGKITADNDADKTLTVAGTVIITDGELATGDTDIDTNTTYAINITGSGSIEAGEIVIKGAGALYDATGTNAKPISIKSDDGFVGDVNGKITLKGATTINAAKGQVVLSVVGGGSADTGTFLSAATNGQLAISVTTNVATIKLDNGTAVGSALTIGDKGSLAVNGGIIAIAGTNSTLVSSSTTAKFSIDSTATLKVGSTSTGNDAAFTIGTGAFSNTGTFAAGSVGTYTGNGTFWAKDA
jgi:hypothetical protein